MDIHDFTTFLEVSRTRHFGQAARDIAEIRISADKAGRRAQRLDNFDFEELAQRLDAYKAEEKRAYEKFTAECRVA